MTRARGGEEYQYDRYQPNTSGLLKALEYLGRPLNATVNVLRTTPGSTGVLGMLLKSTLGEGVAARPEGLSINPLKAGYQGITGQVPSTTSDLLNDLGITNRFVNAPLSFGGDILFDPLMYVGLRAVTGPTKSAEQLAGFKAARAALNFKKLDKEVEVATRLAQQAAGPKPISLATKENIRTNIVEKAVGEARQIGESVISQMPDKALAVRIGGKNVLVSEKAWKPIAKSAEWFGETRLGGGLNKMFRTNALLPEHFNFWKQVFEGSNSAKENMFRREVNDLLSGLEEDELIAISHALERPMGPLGISSKSGIDLDDVKLKVKAKFKMFEDVLKDIGALSKDDAIENYVPHFVKRKSRKNAKLQRKISAVGLRDPAILKDRTVPTLKALRDAGYEPIENIAEIMNTYGNIFYRFMSHHEFVNKILADYGIKFTGKGTAKLKQLAQEFEMEPITKEDSRWINYAKLGLDEKQNLYLPKEAKEAVRAMEKVFTDDEAMAGFRNLFDAANTELKFVFTAVNPRFHFSSLLGDVWNGWLNGLSNPRFYKIAKRIMDKDISGDVEFKIGNQVLTKTKIEQLLLEKGVRHGSFAHQLSAELTEGRGLSRGLTKAKAKVQRISEGREDFVRIANFVHGLDDELKRMGRIDVGKQVLAIDQAANKSVQRVFKFLFNYNDLTRVEKDVFKRLFFFYTYLRKNVPLQLEMLFTNPGRVMAGPKLFSALEQLSGIEAGALPGVNYALPEWMREVLHSRVGSGDTDLPIYALPDLPLNQLLRTLKGEPSAVIQEVLASLNPVARIPLEIGADRSFFTGANLRLGSPWTAEGAKRYAKYLSGQMPQSRLTSNIAGGDIPKLWNIRIAGRETTVPVIESLIENQSFFNWVTGLGLYQVKPPQQRGGRRVSTSGEVRARS